MADHDLLVLGGGTGGYAAAFRASQLGKRVLYVDAHPQGPCVASHFGAFRPGGAPPPWAPSPPEPRGRQTVVRTVRVPAATRDKGAFPAVPPRGPLRVGPG